MQLTVDLAVFRIAEDKQLEILLGRRENAPFPGVWGLPGGYVRDNEDTDLQAATSRILHSKCQISRPPQLTQVATIGNQHRDPRHWSVTVLYRALVGKDALSEMAAGEKMQATAWVAVEEALALPLAFDHTELLTMALEHLRTAASRNLLEPAHLLDEHFTLGQLQRMHEIILGHPLDKSSFRRKIAALDQLQPVTGALQQGRQRPAQFYRLADGLPAQPNT